VRIERVQAGRGGAALALRAFSEASMEFAMSEIGT